MITPLIILQNVFALENTESITKGEFGLIWREYFKMNDFDYRFVVKGSGMGRSDEGKEIQWFINKDFRLALLRNIHSNSPEKVIDSTDYSKKSVEPVSGTTGYWSLLGEINQKQTISLDKPFKVNKLPKHIVKKNENRLPDLTR